jgi:hypothetical protein
MNTETFSVRLDPSAKKRLQKLAKTSHARASSASAPRLPDADHGGPSTILGVDYLIDSTAIALNPVYGTNMRSFDVNR